MKIWIDADACPNVIKEIIFRASQRRRLQVCLVANSPVYTPRNPLVTSIVVPKGLDEADNWIIEHVEPEDIVITADIPLAAFIVEKGALGINPRGDEYTAESVRSRLSMRDFMQDLRDSGVQTGGPPSFSTKDKLRFANAFDRALAKRR